MSSAQFFLSKKYALLSPIVKYKTTLGFLVSSHFETLSIGFAGLFKETPSRNKYSFTFKLGNTFGNRKNSAQKSRLTLISLLRSLQVLCEAVDKLSGGEE